MPRAYHLLTLPLLALCAACAAAPVTPPSSSGNGQDEYVEVPNPQMTSAPSAPATIWVPKKSLDSWIPTGGQLARKGFDAAKAGLGYGSAAAGQAAAPPAAPAAGASQAVPAAAAVQQGLSWRVALIAPAAARQVAVAFASHLAGRPSLVVDPLTGLEPPADPAAQAGMGNRLFAENGVQGALLLQAPDGVKPGAVISVALLDTLGNTMVKTEQVVVGTGDNGAAAALADLAARVAADVPLIPWFARVVQVEGDRLYINAGHQTGLNMGQQLALYQGGQLVPGLGFDPGAPVAHVVVAGFFGAKGAVCRVTGVAVRPGALVAPLPGGTRP